MAQGTTPPGARNEQEAARWVRSMFARVTGRYDLLNHLLSLNVDRWWRARAARRLRPLLRQPGARALDLCCGTGDLLLALERAGGRPALGVDFCHPMLASAQRKLAGKGLRSSLVGADALALPLRDASVDVVTTAFGLRNLANYDKGLAEMRRVLRPGGAAAILEFSQPRNRAMAALYGWYSRRLLPALGGAISGDPEAYRYLPDSVTRFPAPERLAEAMRRAGFARVEYLVMTGGIVTLHLGIAA